MNIIDIINKKRLKKELTKEEINYFISNMLNGTIYDYQTSALLMAIVLNGMTITETINLTDAMIKSGDTLDLSEIDGLVVDKHSTGGVGDKVTLVLAPLLASLGFNVAKMSGRGLGHTGGTIDKLESIEGYQVELDKENFIKQVREHKIAIISQTGNMVPADKKLYALRDVTGTVSSIPLIAASIMSKKIASGANFIILDVKVGNGALMTNISDATILANTMIQIGKVYNRHVVCLLTNMSEPLGNNVGNSLEIIESITTLNGNGPKDLEELVISMASLVLSKTKNISVSDANKLAYQKLTNGDAYNKFVELVNCQKGNINNIKVSDNVIEVNSNKTGYIESIDTLSLGELARNIGAGRLNKDSIIDHSVGLKLLHHVGDYVNDNEPLIKIYYNKDIDITYLNGYINNSYKISSTPLNKPKLIYEIIE